MNTTPFAHLPKWLEIAPPTFGLLASAVVLNGIGGGMFGYVQALFGIESAILGHFAGDVVLHVLRPALT